MTQKKQQKIIKSRVIHTIGYTGPMSNEIYIPPGQYVEGGKKINLAENTLPERVVTYLLTMQNSVLLAVHETIVDVDDTPEDAPDDNQDVDDGDDTPEDAPPSDEESPKSEEKLAPVKRPYKKRK